MFSPFIRKAEPKDYETIHGLWMQDYVISWMSFEKEMDSKKFIKCYKRLKNESEIYVLIDEIEGDKIIIGVMRLKRGKEKHNRHVVEFCSLAVKECYRNTGYASFFYEECEKKAREMEAIEGIRVNTARATQSGGNGPSILLVKKYGFLEEAVFPDWLERKGPKRDNGSTGNFYVIERYIYLFLDEEVASLAAKLPSLHYTENFPPMKFAEDDQNITIQRIPKDWGYQFICYYRNEKNLLMTVDLRPNNSVIRHIGFLSIQLTSTAYVSEAIIGLRKILIAIMQEKDTKIKKLELFTADSKVIELCKDLCFFKRGETPASHYVNGKYSNEVGLEYSFFNIQDARNLIEAKEPNPHKRKNLNEALTCCEITIESLVKRNFCDILAARYFENLAYQIVRDELKLEYLVSLSDKRWQALLVKCPLSLQQNLIDLLDSFQSPLPGFFPNKLGETLSHSQQQLNNISSDQNEKGKLVCKL